MSVNILTRPTSKTDPKTGKPICTYHVRWTHDETYTYLGSLPSMALAKKRKAHVENLVAIGAPVSLELFKGKPATARIRLDEAARKYMDAQIGWADSTRENNEGYCKQVLAYWGAHKQCHDITPADVRAWLKHMKQVQKLSANTQRLRKTFLSGALGPLGARVSPNPCKSDEVGRITGRSKKKERPTMELLISTRKALDGDAVSQMIFDLCVHSGMRPGEARLLTWGQVDRSGDKPRLTSVGTKTEEREVLHLGAIQPDWVPYRPEGVKDSDPLFRMSEPTFYARLRKASGMKINPNLLRHVHATLLYAWRNVHHDMAEPDMALRMGHSVEKFRNDYASQPAPSDWRERWDEFCALYNHRTAPLDCK